MSHSIYKARKEIRKSSYLIVFIVFLVPFSQKSTYSWNSYLVLAFRAGGDAVTVGNSP